VKVRIIDGCNAYYAILVDESGAQVGEEVCLGDGVDLIEGMWAGEEGFLAALEALFDDETIGVYWPDVVGV
jgi:hypothetical protein